MLPKAVTGWFALSTDDSFEELRRWRTAGQSQAPKEVDWLLTMLFASYCMYMMLHQKYMPKYDFSERHAIEIAVPAEQVMAAVTAYRPENDPFFRFAIGLREFPSRIVKYVCRRNDSPPLFLSTISRC